MLDLFIFGYVFLIYGLVKFLICYLEIVLTYQQKTHLSKKFSLFRHILTTDVSTAGRTLGVIYIVFAVITILKSIERIHSGIIHRDVVDIINERLFVYLIYIILGFLLVFIYSIVIYTNMHIDKNVHYERRYKIMGVCGGLTFIASVPMIYLFHKISDYGVVKAININIFMSIFLVMISLLLVSVLIYIGYSIIRDDKKCAEKSVSLYEILTLFVIPTNII